MGSFFIISDILTQMLGLRSRRDSTDSIHGIVLHYSTYRRPVPTALLSTAFGSIFPSLGLYLLPMLASQSTIPPSSMQPGPTIFRSTSFLSNCSR